MTNHPNRNKRFKRPAFTSAEVAALIEAASQMEAGEWDQTQTYDFTYEDVITARNKLIAVSHLFAEQG